MRQAVLAATVGLLTTEGLSGTTMSAVAHAAGVHETSLYRRWGTRENLIYEALAAHTDDALPMPDTGDVREDLARLMEAVARYLATPEGSALLHLGAAPDAEVVEEGRRPYWNARLERGEAIVRRGVERGELAAGTDPRLVAELLAGPLFSRVLLTGDPLEEGLARRVVDLILDGARPRAR
ncbi:TetR/AcrR family transcriptional regulator C-terminal ligand-binding domain-containing protein [Streptomyces sp. DT24]|uniref:TetR/AcrR family transcriptional regulator C-terminal ligand-binding domain-containing protein n=1 Tax=unclassified Streptomyces TaxID=2593676 RepID=UPI0023B9DB2E|nr:TetR/AcrR family transcriptional regulator C-terminal ligand-binding domain-containing protein [Streptomyces sp. AM 4-1-1]WEH37350.1 TetR/AcrR family transcriptional regulator C-terminal ligand-binding domain-containing protein [Streptomyces sp. AM 4-1-1]